MAQKVTTHLVDDLTGDTIDEGKGRTVSFSFDGNHYEIDLSDDNADALREAFSDYVAAARKVSGRQNRTSGGTSAKRGNSDELAVEASKLRGSRKAQDSAKLQAPLVRRILDSLEPDLGNFKIGGMIGWTTAREATIHGLGLVAARRQGDEWFQPDSPVLELWSGMGR